MVIENRNSIAAHPIVIFAGIWSFVFLLYALALSEQLIYDIDDFLYLYGLIVGSFLLGYYYTNLVAYTALRACSHRRKPSAFEASPLPDIAIRKIWRRLLTLFWFWALITITEIFFSGGLPIIWLVTGSEKTYRDFGIPSVHGFLMSVLLACSTLSFFLFLKLRQKKYLAIPLFSLLWFVISVTRNYLIGSILQFLFLFLATRRVAASQVLKIALGFVCLIIFFGVLGDLRSGGDDLIRAVGRPTDRFPDWLPTGFLWVYIYLTTPLNNLFNTIHMNSSIDGFSLSGTTAQLLPTFIRNMIFTEDALSRAELVDENLNVSTGFIGPYLDVGLLGIVGFSVLYGLTAGLFWRFRRSPFYLLGYLFMAQAMFLSIFYNQMLYLPYLFQLFWYWYILRAQSSTMVHGVQYSK